MVESFSSAHVSFLTSRCGLFTGLHTGHCAVDRNEYPNTPLRPTAVTVAEVLHDAGYATGYVGKWGLGGELSDGTPNATHSTPNAKGFDHFFGYLDQGLAHDYSVRLRAMGHRVAPIEMVQGDVYWATDTPAGEDAKRVATAA